MIIRSNLNTPDFEIMEDTIEDFNKEFLSFLKLVSDRQSEYYMKEDDIFNKLIYCAKRVMNQSLEGCPVIFDSWSCFNSTPSGSIQTEPCPEFSNFKFSSARLAYKYCDNSGSWWVHPATNRTWSNYTSCVDFPNLEFHTILNSLHFIGLIISLCFLTFSLLIFYLFDCLDSSRVTIHKNLLISLWLNSVLWITWIYFVLHDTDVWSSNGIWCRVTHIITTYTTLTTYMWMLCEGIFLKLILSKLNVNERMILYLQLFGWISPIFITIPYVIHRLLQENNNCWIESGNSNLFLGVPVIIVILLNIVLLVNVLLILKAKLRSSRAYNHQNSTPERSQEIAAKQARAILFLAPILGLNFLPFPIRPAAGSGLEDLYDVMMAIFSGFQGCFVSIILCFSNSEVIAVVKRKIHQNCLSMFEP